MQALKLFQWIKNTLEQQRIGPVVSYTTEDQDFPYIVVDIQNWSTNSLIQPKTARADVKITLLSRYKGVKELAQMSEMIIKTLENTAQMILVEQSSWVEKDALTRHKNLMFKAIVRE